MDDDIQNEEQNSILESHLGNKYKVGVFEGMYDYPDEFMKWDSEIEDMFEEELN
ncbi:MAG: hypothetical protein SPL99_02855 [Catonella sp.]|jgi:hypothetical protein|nr:hypothetical protein [Catonella sp.]MDY6356530.1 hypothetical protein [Catonella sp.]